MRIRFKNSYSIYSRMTSFVHIFPCRPTTNGPLPDQFHLHRVQLHLNLIQHWKDFLHLADCMCVDTRKAVMAVEPNFFQYSHDVDLNMSSSGCIYIYIYGGFLKWWYLYIIYVQGIFNYKPSISGYPHCRKSPYQCWWWNWNMQTDFAELQVDCV